MYIVSSNAHPQNTYFAMPPGRGLGDTDLSTALSQAVTAPNLLLMAGTVIAGIIALHYLGQGGSRRRPRRRRGPAEPPAMISRNSAILQGMVALALVGGTAYVVGKKTA